jgi:hypothetical protein
VLDGAGVANYVAIYEIDSPDVLLSKEWAEAGEKGRWPSEVRPYTSNRSTSSARCSDAGVRHSVRLFFASKIILTHESRVRSNRAGRMSAWSGALTTALIMVNGTQLDRGFSTR